MKGHTIVAENTPTIEIVMIMDMAMKEIEVKKGRQVKITSTLPMIEDLLRENIVEVELITENTPPFMVTAETIVVAALTNILVEAI